MVDNFWKTWIGLVKIYHDTGCSKISKNEELINEINEVLYK